MNVNSDFKDLLRYSNEEGARYLVVGAHAVMTYTEPRYTKDLDLWIEPSIENTLRALRFSERLHRVSPSGFDRATPGGRAIAQCRQ